MEIVWLAVGLVMLACLAYGLVVLCRHDLETYRHRPIAAVANEPIKALADRLAPGRAVKGFTITADVDEAVTALVEVYVTDADMPLVEKVGELAEPKIVEGGYCNCPFSWTEDLQHCAKCGKAVKQ